MCLQDELKFTSLVLQDKCNIEIFLSSDLGSWVAFIANNMFRLIPKCSQKLLDRFEMNLARMILW